MSKNPIELYTDGSCHTELKIGGWAVIILIKDTKVLLHGTVENTSHNRMELTAVLKAFEYLRTQAVNFDKLNVYSDSQYVVNICERKEKLKKKNFLTNKGTAIQNSDIVQRLIEFIETHEVTFIKVKAHQKKSQVLNYNREVDMLIRKLVREKVKERKD